MPAGRAGSVISGIEVSRAKLRVCSEPGCPTLGPRPRCPEHQAQVDRHQRRTTPTKVNRSRDIERRAEAVAAHRAVRGDWCPGFERPPHASADLTADHRVDQALGGAWDGELDVLCRACNGRKGRRAQLAMEAYIRLGKPVKSDTPSVRTSIEHERPGGYPRRDGTHRRRRGGLKKVRRVQDDPGGTQC